MYKTIVNQTITSEINPAQLDWDLLELKDGKFHILVDNQAYQATLVGADYVNKTFEIKVNKKTYQVQVKDKFDQLVDQLGFSNMAAKKINNIKAPMPGLVLDILVKEGDVLQKGDSVLILEAMKMENVIKAEGDATVKEITTQKGNAVEKNQILIEFE
jgi:biotin carboxyl carrier protein